MKLVDLMVGRLMVILALLVLIVAMTAGCNGTLNEQFVRAVDSNWTLIGKEYRAYVDADESMSPSSKELRIKTIEEFTALVEEAKAKANE